MESVKESIIEPINNFKINNFKIKNINILASWSYNLSKNQDCSICRNSINENSLQHQEKGLESIPAVGICGHSYHFECIKLWIDGKNEHCPICHSKWAYKK